MKRKMDPEGYLPITLIATFPLIKCYTNNLTLIIESIQDSDQLEINDFRVSRFQHK